MTDILKRLAELERRIAPEPMIIEAEDPGGGIHEMTVTEAINKGFGFVRVIRGGNLHDLDKLLAVMTDAAYNKEELQ